MVQENNMKTFALLLTIFILSGCSFKQIKPTNYYTLETNSTLPTYSSTQKSIAIVKPKINVPYSSKNIYFTQKSYIFESYLVNKWIDFPALIIQNMLYDTFQSSLLFNNVTLDTFNSSTDLTFQSHIQKLFHKYEDQNSYAIIQVKFELVKQNSIVKTFYFSKKILCEENSPYGFIKASNQGFKEIQIELLNSLEKTI